MNKLGRLLMAAAILAVSCLSFAGCKGPENKKEDEFKVGAIYLTAKSDTSGNTYAHNQGIIDAMKEAGLDTSNALCVADNVPEETEKVNEAIDRLIGDGCKIIFATSGGYTEAMKGKAVDHPEIVFANAAGDKSNDTNYTGYYGKMYQAEYLAGIAAGYKSFVSGNNNLGFVSTDGASSPQTCALINSFTLAVKTVNPSAVINVYKLPSNAGQDEIRIAAQTLAETYGCGVIAQDVDSTIPQIVANEFGISACGYNANIVKEAEFAYLTAPIWNWKIYYSAAIKAAMTDKQTFMKTSGNYYGGLDTGLVDITALTENCEPETAEAITIARDLMTSGKWDVFSGTKLYFSGEKDAVAVEQKAESLKTNQGQEIVAAGGAPLDAGLVMTSMDYYVEGIVQVN